MNKENITKVTIEGVDTVTEQQEAEVIVSSKVVGGSTSSALTQADISESEMVNVEISEAFPYTSKSDINDTLSENDVLIDAGVVTSSDNTSVSLSEILRTYADSSDSETMNHALLNGLEVPNQHPISAIIGLQDTLERIKVLGKARSSEGTAAIYYPWYTPYTGENRTGYFVSYQPVAAGEEGGIIIADQDSEIIGVTVESAGYEGNYAETVIDGITVGRQDDQNYGLVAFAGIVNVRCEGNIPIGGWVVPNENGIAELSGNESGYLVLAKGNNLSYNFVSIFLGSNGASLAKLRDSLENIAEFTDEDKARLDDAVTSEELAEVLAKIDVLNKNDTEHSGVIDDLQGEIEELEKIIEDAKNQTDSTAAQIEDIHKTVAEIKNSTEESIDSIRNDVQSDVSEIRSSVDKTSNDMLSEIAVINSSISNISANFAEGGTIADIQKQVDDNSAKIESITVSNLPTMQSIAQLKQQVDENGGLIQSLVVDIQKYSVGEYSQAYRMSHEQAKDILSDGIIYVPITQHYETYGDYTIHFNVSDSETYGLAKRYMWQKSSGKWIPGAYVRMTDEYFAYDGTTATTNLWYCTANCEHTFTENDVERTEQYYDGTLYLWKEGTWVAVAHVRDNQNTRAMGAVFQRADSLVVQYENLEGDFSRQEQTVDKISQIVGGSEGDVSQLEVTKYGIYGEVFNPNGTMAVLRAHADSSQAVIDLITSGYYHRIEQALATPVPSPVGDRYKTRPQWNQKAGRFEFDVDEENVSDDGIYYFFDENQTHYCKLVGDQYIVYTIGNLANAQVDQYITDQESAIGLIATFDTDSGGTLAAIRNKATADAAKIDLIASMSTAELVEVYTPVDFTITIDGYPYTKAPEYDVIQKKYVFDEDYISEDGLYFAGLDDVDKDITIDNSYRKLIPDGQGGFIGYELYRYASGSTAAIVQNVTDNASNISIVVDENGVKAGAVVNAINNSSEVKIYGDKIDIQGVTAVRNGSGSTTTIDGSVITTGQIKNPDYLAPADGDKYSQGGTSFYLDTGELRSKNLAIDKEGNLYIKGTLEGAAGVFQGELQVGLNSDEDYNFKVDSDGNMTAHSGTFMGVVDAADIRIGGASILGLSDGDEADDSDKIQWDFLELHGLTIKNKQKQKTLEIDDDGNVFITGQITFLDSNDVEIDMDDIIQNTDDALSNAANAYGLAEAIANGTNTIGTFINQDIIYSPKIHTNLLTIQSRDSSWSEPQGKIEFKGFFGKNLETYLQIYGWDSGSAPGVIFKGSDLGYCQLNFGDISFGKYTQINFSGATVDFSGAAKVEGLKDVIEVVPVFG